MARLRMQSVIVTPDPIPHNKAVKLRKLAYHSSAYPDGEAT